MNNIKDNLEEDLFEEGDYIHLPNEDGLARYIKLEGPQVKHYNNPRIREQENPMKVSAEIFEKFLINEIEENIEKEIFHKGVAKGAEYLLNKYFKK